MAYVYKIIEHKFDHLWTVGEVHGDQFVPLKDFDNWGDARAYEIELDEAAGNGP